MKISFEYHRGTEDNSWEKYGDVQRIELESSELRIFCKDKNELYFNLNQCSNLEIQGYEQDVVEAKAKETWRKAKRKPTVARVQRRPLIIEFREVIPNFPSDLLQNIDAVTSGRFTYRDKKELDCERIETEHGLEIARPNDDYVIRSDVIDGIHAVKKTFFSKFYNIVEDRQTVEQRKRREE